MGMRQIISYSYVIRHISHITYHRRRKILNIGGALDIIAREICWPRPHFVQTTPIETCRQEFLGCSNEGTNSKSSKP